jgi:YD repeat-containing protein
VTTLSYASLLTTVLAATPNISKRTLIAMVIASTALLSACGGGGGGSGSSAPESVATVPEVADEVVPDEVSPEVVVPLEGQFIDSEVFGLRYETDSQAGTTDVDGIFLYLAGEQVRFYVGEYLLGEVAAKEIVTPFDLAGIEPLTGAELAQALAANGKGLAFNKMLGIAGLLQTIDSDNNPDNGISITPEVAALFTADSLLGSDGKPLPADELNSSLVTQALLKKALNQGALSPREMRTNQQILAHLYVSLEVGTGSKVLSQQITTTTIGDSLRLVYSYNDQGLVTDIREDRPSAVMSPDLDTSYTYNAAGQVLTITTDSGEDESYTYNTAGQVLTKTRGMSQETFTYDDKGNLVERTDSRGSTTYTYDDNGNALTRAFNGSLQETNTYDDNGKLLSRIVAGFFGDESSESYSYDDNGNIQTRFTSSEFFTLALRFNYDGSGNLINIEVCNPSTDTTADLIINSTDCVVDSTTTYDDSGNELIVLSNEKMRKISEKRYDDKGNIIFFDNSGSFVTYNFDAAGKLVSERFSELNVSNDPIHEITYSYDADDNLVSEVFQYLNQIGGYTTSYEYADNNALVSIPVASIGNSPLFDNSLETDIKTDGVVYNLGDTGPGGGIVFYTDFNGYYLEVAPSDVQTDPPAPSPTSAEIQHWSNLDGCLAGTPTFDGNYNAFAYPLESFASIGNGKINTQLFTDNCPSVSGQPKYAAEAAVSYISPNGTDDWFLPSIGELNQLYKYAFPGFSSDPDNNAEVNLAGRLWSSTETTSTGLPVPGTSAFYQQISTGQSSPGGKTSTFSVRPVREFRAGAFPDE